MFTPKPFKDANFWFTKGEHRTNLLDKFDCLMIDTEELETKLETKDLLETVTGSPSEQKAAKEEENKIKEKEDKIETQTLLIQQVRSKEHRFSQ